MVALLYVSYTTEFPYLAHFFVRFQKIIVAILLSMSPIIFLIFLELHPNLKILINLASLQSFPGADSCILYHFLGEVKRKILIFATEKPRTK